VTQYLRDARYETEEGGGDARRGEDPIRPGTWSCTTAGTHELGSLCAGEDDTDTTFKRVTKIMWEAHTKAKAGVKTCHKKLAELYEESLREKSLTVTIELAQ
jgi:hypothetical protein